MDFLFAGTGNELQRRVGYCRYEVVGTFEVVGEFNGFDGDGAACLFDRLVVSLNGETSPREAYRQQQASRNMAVCLR